MVPTSRERVLLLHPDPAEEQVEMERGQGWIYPDFNMGIINPLRVPSPCGQNHQNVLILNVTTLVCVCVLCVRFIYFYLMCMPESMYMQHMGAVPIEARRGHQSSPETGTTEGREPL